MHKLLNLVGFTTIFISGMITISIIFPSLFSSIFGKFPTDIIPFELGISSIPVIVSNIILILFGILYYKKKLPGSISNSINKIRTFEISKKPCLIILLIIFSIYIGFSIPDLSLNEAENWPDFVILQHAFEIWPYGESDNIYVEEQNDRYVRMFLLTTSHDVFDNVKILPFFASILVILFTYLLTVQITEKRFAGIIAIIVLIQSHTFLRFDTVAVYENFWVLFYLISIYIIKKQWVLSPVFYILSFFTKAFVAPFFIMTLFFGFSSTISLKKKLSLLISYMFIIAVSLILIFYGDSLYPNVINIDPTKFFIGLATFGPLLRFDYLLLLTFLPVVIGLTVLAKTNDRVVNSVLFLILGTLLAGPALIVFTNFYEILPYRYIPFIIFFSIGFSLFFSKKTNS